MLPALGDARDALLLNLGRTTVRVAYQVRFYDEWQGDLPVTRWNKKTPIRLDDELTWPELGVVRLLEKAGWEGAWVTGWQRSAAQGPQLLVGSPSKTEDATPPPDATARHLAVVEANGGWSGAWDVFAWAGPNGPYGFVEVKAKDRILPNQEKWCGAALDAGFHVEDLLMLRWIRRSAPKPR